jgi:uncharacterized protein YbjT (DUF2867 family)
MRVLVTGATGYIGGRLVPLLLDAGNDVRCVARDPDRLAGRFPGAEIVHGDVFDPVSTRAALDGIDVAYYLVHSMAKSKHFAHRDREAAEIFAAAAKDAGVARIVFLGGLGSSSDVQLSKHLQSRHDTGDALRSTGIAVTEFRAAVIVGSGSASFEMLRALTEKLPVMLVPKWVSTCCQPIAIRDVLAYLVAALDTPASAGRIVEIGGADILTYGEMMLRYAKIRGLHRTLVGVPFFSPRISSYWVHFVTPIPANIARPLIDGLRNEVIVRDTSGMSLFTIRPMGYDEAVQRALNRYLTTGPDTTWFGAYDVRRLPGNFSGLTEGMVIDRREIVTPASPHALFRVFTSLGGKRGWLYADFLWELRGIMDRMVGGIGTRRGRRSPTDLRLGDAVDFWRVEAYVPDRLLRLRAEMKLPGLAWLQFEAEPREDGRTALRQTAFYEPRGTFGYLYWYSVLPFHGPIFGNMVRRIAALAEAEPSVETNVAAAG